MTLLDGLTDDEKRETLRLLSKKVPLTDKDHVVWASRGRVSRHQNGVDLGLSGIVGLCIPEGKIMDDNEKLALFFVNDVDVRLLYRARAGKNEAP
jgi:hypothetical protein